MSSDLVLEHLRDWARHPFRWGETDCCLAIADYVLAVTGIDCAAHLRGRYDSRETCDALTGWGTDPVAVMDACANAVPLERCAPSRVRRGDVCLLQLSTQVAVAGLVLGPGRLGVRGEAGVLVLPLVEQRILAAWRV